MMRPGRHPLMPRCVTLFGVLAGCHQTRMRTTMSHMPMVYRRPVGVMRQSVRSQLAIWDRAVRRVRTIRPSRSHSCARRTAPGAVAQVCTAWLSRAVRAGNDVLKAYGEDPDQPGWLIQAVSLLVDTGHG
jgi:hypothetical protein